MNTMFRLAKGLALTTLLATGSVIASDDDQVSYSTEGYCILANEGVDPRFLAAYEKKLGTRPDDKVCASFRDVVSVLRPKEWDFRGRKPYPFSAITLSVAQIEAIREARNAAF